MNAETFVKLIEEMIDLKIRQQTEANLKVGANVAQLLQEKRNTDRRRLDQIRAELLKMFGG